MGFILELFKGLGRECVNFVLGLCVCAHTVGGGGGGGLVNLSWIT